MIDFGDDFDVERSRATHALDYVAPCPPDMVPKDYQHAGVEYALQRDHMLFGDAPGLGKTAECIMLGNAIEAKRTLVICPASLRLNWVREIDAWSTTEKVFSYPIIKSKDGVNPHADYVVTSYSLLANPSIMNAVMSMRWDHVILDEAHALKDPKVNTRTRVVCSLDLLPSVTGRFTLASGTILPNQPIECYNAIRLLNWASIDFMSLEGFRRNYYREGEGFVTRFVNEGGVRKRKAVWVTDVRNVPTNLDDLQFRLRKYTMIRRLKENVLSQLPDKQWMPVPLELNAGIRKVMKGDAWKAVEKMYDMDPDGFDKSVPIDGAVATARREMGEAKVPAVVQYVEELMLDGREKLVIGAYHLSVLRELKDSLAHHGLVYMDGGTSNALRQQAVDQFQNDPSVKIILGQMLTLGEGWTLTAAQDVVFAEFDWVPGKNEQMFDRIHRLGQTGDYTLGHLPMVPGTLDERMLATVIEKDQSIYAALDAQ